MKLTLPNSSPYDISPFPHPIDTEKSTYRVSSVKVEIVLFKKDLGIKWSGLTGEGDHDGGELDLPFLSRLPTFLPRRRLPKHQTLTLFSFLLPTTAFSAPHSKEETTPAVARQKKDWSKLADEAIKSPVEGESVRSIFSFPPSVL